MPSILPTAPTFGGRIPKGLPPTIGRFRFCSKQPLPQFLIALLTLLLSACQATTVYQPVDSDAMAGRSTLVLRPTFVAPVSEKLHKRIIDEVEARLLDYPHLGRVRSRADFARLSQGDRKLRREYNLFSDTLTVVGVTDADGSSRLGKSADVEMLISAQLFYMPCPLCEFGSQLGLVTNLVEASTGKLLWRGHFTSSVPDDNPEAQATTAQKLVENFFLAFDEDLRPKWHRRRFRGLSRLGSS